MFEVGLSVPGTPDINITEETFREYRDAGLKHLELSYSKIDTFFDFSKMKSYADKYGLNLWSYHLPFLPFTEIDISNPKLADYTVDFLSKLIKRAAEEADIHLIVIHPSGEPIEEDERATRMECAKKSLARLAEFAMQYGTTLAVEDLPRTCLARNSDELLELVSAHDALRICFDTNHLLNEHNEDFVKKAADKMVTIHVSDYDFGDERHYLPGEGMIDWQSLIHTLKECGYKGPWLYEVGRGSSNKIARVRDLAPADYTRNAEELFADKEITLIERTYLMRN